MTNFGYETATKPLCGFVDNVILPVAMAQLFLRASIYNQDPLRSQNSLKLSKYSTVTVVIFVIRIVHPVANPSSQLITDERPINCLFCKYRRAIGFYDFLCFAYMFFVRVQIYRNFKDLSYLQSTAAELIYVSYDFCSRSEAVCQLGSIEARVSTRDKASSLLSSVS